MKEKIMQDEIKNLTQELIETRGRMQKLEESMQRMVSGQYLFNFIRLISMTTNSALLYISH